MKNKFFNKRFSKILVTMCLLLTMVMGSCMSVSAEVNTSQSYFFEYNNSDGKYRYSTVNFSVNSSSSPIYSFVFNPESDISSISNRMYFVSSSPFNYSVNVTGDAAFPPLTNDAVFDSGIYYYSVIFRSYSWTQLITFPTNIDYVVNTASDFRDTISVFKYVLGISDVIPDGVTIEGDNGMPSNPEYDLGATATIAPPSGVTYYEYVDTSQGSVTSSTVRKGQLQWNVPDDDSLYIEIYADLIYKEGLFNKKTQVVYPWKTLSKSGLKADTNKLLFDRFQAGSDYFAENGLDESAFSSHVVNGYYLRFCKINDDKSVSYSLWNKISILRDNSLTQICTASSETGIFDENGNWVNKQIVNSEIVDGGGKLPAFSPGLDDDGNNLPTNNNGLDLDSLLTDSNIFERFIGYLKSAMSALGELPQYVGQLFSFLPQEIIGLLGFGVIIAIILRIIGR